MTAEFLCLSSFRRNCETHLDALSGLSNLEGERQIAAIKILIISRVIKAEVFISATHTLQRRIGTGNI